MRRGSMRGGAACLTLALVAAGAASAQAPSCAGDTATVQRGDTLSRISERCDVTEAAILSANPQIEGSSDLQVGGTLRLRSEGDTSGRLGETLNTFGSEANNALGRVAGRIGSSVQDLLDKNPDLKSRLEGLGRKVGIGDAKAAPSATVTPQSGAAGATVTVSATGLPPEFAVVIGAGLPGSATEVVQDARTSSTGTLSTNVAVPAWATGATLVFTIRVGDAVKARTGRFQVAP